MGLVHVVNLMAEILQAGAFIARICGSEFRQDAPHRLVLVVVILELLQCGQQRIPTSLGDPDGEHDEEGIQACLFNDDAVFGKVFGDDGSRNAGLAEFAIQRQAGRDNCGLDWIQHVEAGFNLSEAMPVILAIDHPVITVSDAISRKLFRSPHLEPPVFTPFLVDFFHRTTEVERFENTFFDQCGTTRRLHHGGGNVARGNDGVLG